MKVAILIVLLAHLAGLSHHMSPTGAAPMRHEDVLHADECSDALDKCNTENRMLANEVNTLQNTVFLLKEDASKFMTDLERTLTGPIRRFVDPAIADEFTTTPRQKKILEAASLCKFNEQQMQHHLMDLQAELDWYRAAGKIALALSVLGGASAAFLIIVGFFRFIWNQMIMRIVAAIMRADGRPFLSRYRRMQPDDETPQEVPISSTPATPHGSLASVNLEAYVTGSEYKSVTALPSTQFTILAITDNGRLPVPMGSGFWLEDWLVTAKHVVNQITQDDMLLTTASNYAVVNKSDWISIAGQVDLCAIRYDPLKFQKLGLSKSVMHKLRNLNALPATVAALGKQSFGVLKTETSSLGNLSELVLYQGSTAPGFSGSPYLVNGKAVAMHLGSEAMGIGYDVNYLVAVLRRTKGLEGYRPESSDMYTELIEGIESGETTYSTRPGALLLKSGTKYYTFNEDDDEYDVAWEKIEKRRNDLSRGSNLRADAPEFVYDPHAFKADIKEALDEVRRESFDPLEAVRKANAKQQAEIESLEKQKQDLLAKQAKADKTLKEISARLNSLEARSAVASPVTFLDREAEPKNSARPSACAEGPSCSVENPAPSPSSTIHTSPSLTLESMAQAVKNMSVQELIRVLPSGVLQSIASTPSKKRQRRRKLQN
uniref:Serine protease n=1 Tax=Soybean thrips sobemo-like virus 2 TaxID=2800868 RepID=A0A7T8JIC3_9VIRU|nr:hypothetical protein STSLV2_gp1 [Soybean thrips sobemo-like virus 2]